MHRVLSIIAMIGIEESCRRLYLYLVLCAFEHIVIYTHIPRQRQILLLVHINVLLEKVVFFNFRMWSKLPGNQRIFMITIKTNLHLDIHVQKQH